MSLDSFQVPYGPVSQRYGYVSIVCSRKMSSLAYRSRLACVTCPGPVSPTLAGFIAVESRHDELTSTLEVSHAT